MTLNEARKLFNGYVITGTLVSGKRFKRSFDKDGALWAMGINLWRGSVWGIRISDGKRQLLKRIWN